jgi:signal transduction histidine kinase
LESPDQSKGVNGLVITGAEDVATRLRTIIASEERLDVFLPITGEKHNEQILRILTADPRISSKSVRMITDIGPHNLNQFRSLVLANFELRHLNGITSTFILGDRTFACFMSTEKLGGQNQLFLVTSEKLLEEQHKIFEKVWNIAAAAPLRIRELELTHAKGITEVIDTPALIEQACLSGLSSARNEILLIIPTVNSFERQRELGLLEALSRGAQGNVVTKVLVPSNDTVRSQLFPLLSANNIKVHFIQPGIGPKSMIVVTDRNRSLVVEIRDDTKTSFQESVGFATVSTIKPTVISYVTLFENYWNHAESFEKLQRADRMKEEFINIAAHELRTPIMPILGVIEVLMSGLDEKSDPSLRQDFEIIYRNADRLKRLAEDILNVSRIESGNFRLEIEECDVNAVILDAISEIQGGYSYWQRNREAKALAGSSKNYQGLVQTAGEEKESLYSMIMTIIGDRNPADHKAQEEIITFSPITPRAIRNPNENENTTMTVAAAAVTSWDTVKARIDPKKTKQVIYNLLSNALKFTDVSAGSKIFVSALLVDSEHIRVSVKDRGKGIDPTIMERMFERFASKSDSGTGLGLYISKRIVEAHGGSIGAENNIDGRGATIWFTLPLSPYSVLDVDRNESIDRLSQLRREIEMRRTSLDQMRTEAMQKITDMKEKLIDARDRAVKSRDNAIQEYQKKVEASRGLLRTRQELLNEQINSSALRRNIDNRVERGLDGLSAAIEHLRHSFEGDEALDKLILHPSFSELVSLEAQRVIDTEFFRSLQKQISDQPPMSGDKARNGLDMNDDEESHQ